MKIIVDTHTLFWFLTADKRLSNKAQDTIEYIDRIYIPTIVLLELLYLFQKKGQKENFSFAFDKLKDNSKYTFLSLDVAIIEEVFKLSSKLEMHDSIVTALAQLLNAFIVTRDKKIQEVYKKTIW